jgi:hypothetical protein
LHRRSKQPVVLILTCVNTAHCKVAFEPWGSVHDLRSDDALNVEFTGNDLEIEISYLPDGITLAEWSEADIRVHDRSGRELQL